MRIAALLSFYDETDEMLQEAICSLKGFCDALVAVDGAYALYPNGKGSSRGHEAIRQACVDSGLELLLYVPEAVWAGNETHKREFMFRLGETLTEPDDWFFILDGDFVVTDHLGARGALEDVEKDVCSVTLNESTGIVLHPLLFRAVRGITVGPAHHYWKTPDGRYLWHPLRGVPKHELYREVIVEHRTRSKSRTDQALAYYAIRDRAGIETPANSRPKPERRRRRQSRASRSN
jgi:hypothetical protein